MVRATRSLRPTLAQKVGLALCGLLMVAGAISVLALVSSIRTREFYEDLLAEQLAQARAISGLEISALELSHRMSAHLLRYAEGHESAEPSPEVGFETWMRRLKDTELEPDQRHLLPEIETAFSAYSALWPRVLAHEPSVQDDHEGRGLVADLSAAHARASGLCKRLSAINERDIRAAMAAEREQGTQVTYWIVALAGLLVALAIAITWLLWHGMLQPLRRIVGKLRGATPGRGPGRVSDDLQALEAGVIGLGEEVAQMRVRLSHSDRHLLDADKLATMAKLAAGVAHEIRSPLTSIRLRLFALQRRIQGIDPAQSDNVRVMAEEVTRLDGIVCNFLEFSRPPLLAPQPCSLWLLTDKTLEVLRHRIDGSHLRIERAEEPGLPPALVDPRQLRQVIMNLLNNAIEAVPPGGRIRIEAVRDPAASDPPFLLLRIADNGGGVPLEVRETLFDPFSSTKAEGAGLGLWIARTIAIQHGGSLMLERTSASETVFALRIPVANGGRHGPNPGD